MRFEKKGFALIEILIAAAMLGVIGAAAGSAFSVLAGSLEGARARVEISRTGESLMWFILSELNNAFITPGKEFAGSVKDGRPEISFYSTRAFPGESVKDVYRVSYMIKEGVLWKNVDENSFVLAEGIDNFSLRYYDMSEWVDEWDSAETGVLPAAVEIKFTVKEEDFMKIASTEVDAFFGQGRRTPEAGE
jgi:prepilin-type N-terminal cleavage/methylation domain-containing protein